MVAPPQPSNHLKERECEERRERKRACEKVKSEEALDEEEQEIEEQTWSKNRPPTVATLHPTHLIPHPPKSTIPSTGSLTAHWAKQGR